MTMPELPPLIRCEPAYSIRACLHDDEGTLCTYESHEARERILLARIAELTTERDDALRKSAGARKYKEIVVKQKKKYVYVASLAELAGAGNDKALACLLPCATVARDPGRNLKDVMDAALAASGGVFGKTADPYTDLEQAK